MVNKTIISKRTSVNASRYMYYSLVYNLTDFETACLELMLITLV